MDVVAISLITCFRPQSAEFLRGNCNMKANLTRFSMLLLLMAAIAARSNDATGQVPTELRPSDIQSVAPTKPPVVQRLGNWTRAKWEAAKLRWADNNVKFKECSNTLQKETKSNRMSLHDQRHFMYDCMNKDLPDPFAKSAVVARVKAWTLQQWNAGKERWKQDQDKFSNCNNKLNELQRQKKLSRHDEREFLVHCMGDAP